MISTSVGYGAEIDFKISDSHACRVFTAIYAFIGMVIQIQYMKLAIDGCIDSFGLSSARLPLICNALCKIPIKKRIG